MQSTVFYWGWTNAQRTKHHRITDSCGIAVAEWVHGRSRGRRGGWRRGFGERFGRIAPEKLASIAGGKVLWLHAVSVGEIGVCAQLVASLRPQLARWKFVVTTTTTTGMGEEIGRAHV